MTLTIISLGILLSYTVGVCLYSKKIPNSLSQSVFELRGAQILLWYAGIFGPLFLIAPVLIEVTFEPYRWVAFLACAGLLFVGGAPLVHDKKEMVYKVHTAGAIVCALSAQVLLLLSCWYLLLLWIPYVVVFVAKGGSLWRTKVFWAEMVCFLNTYAYCIYRKMCLG